MDRRTTARVALATIAVAAVAGGTWSAVAGGTETAAECLTGTWLVDPENARRTAAASVSAQLGAGTEPQVVVEGEELRTFDDGTYTNEFVGRRLTITVDLGASVAGSVAELDGVLTGSYRATNTEVTVHDLDASGVEDRLVTIVNGEEFDTGDLGAAAMDGLETGGVFAYRCSGDTLVLTPVVDGVPQPALAIEHTRR